MKKTHKEYGDTARRLGSSYDVDFDPLTWREKFWGTVAILVIAIITIEVVMRIASLF